jgi:hypothetical protein
MFAKPGFISPAPGPSSSSPAPSPSAPGTGAAFRAYSSSGQAISSTVNTKIVFNVEDFDVNSDFDSVTNSRFQPDIAGYYQFTAGVGFTNTLNGNSFLALFKNGVVNVSGIQFEASSSIYRLTIAGLIYLNGTTDYVEVFAYITPGRTTLERIDSTYFMGFLARGS